jgi:hypothetical protein
VGEVEDDAAQRRAHPRRMRSSCAGTTRPSRSATARRWRSSHYGSRRW